MNFCNLSTEGEGALHQAMTTVVEHDICVSYLMNQIGQQTKHDQTEFLAPSLTNKNDNYN